MAKWWIVSIVVCMIVLASSGIMSAQEEDVEVEVLDVNVATLEELQAVTGIDQQLAEAIIAARPYEKLEDLVQVEGMTEDILAELAELVDVWPINMNTATADELMILEGISEELAEAIIEGRPYLQLEDLLQVSGIDEEMLEYFQKYADASLEKKDTIIRGRKSRSKITTTIPVPVTP